MPVDPPRPAAPVVPGYVLEELLGRGGSGQVWRARPRGGGDPVAVKVLVRGDPARQVREAALLAELDHPHLVRLHRVVRREVRGGPAEVSLVLDLLAGGSLAALLSRRGRLRPGEVVTAIAPVAAALAQAHEHGIVHGDLSPGNIVFTAEGRPVLTDLGTARLVGEAGRAEVTPAYVDPVVARGGAPGPASDVFGVAAAAFHALTGIAPWNAAEPGGALGVAAGGHLPDLALLAPDASEELVRVVRRGLSAEPHLRGSAAAFALDLRHACRPEPVRLPASGVPDEVLGETGRGPRTELTHQVAERRARAAHAAPAAESRLARAWAALARRREELVPAGAGAAGNLLRRWAVSVAALLALAGGLVGAAWVGANWGSEGGDGAVPMADSGSVAVGEVPGEVGEGSSAPVAPQRVPADPEPPVPTPTAEPEPGPVPVSGPPAGDADGWAAVVRQLYTQRARAYAAGDGALLAAVYTPGSALLERDAEQIAQLARAGRSVAGFEPTVLRVTSVTGDAERVVVDLVDEIPDHRVGAVGSPPSAAQLVAGRGPTEVQMTLERTADGWRIGDASRAR
ncbi:serine/threonine-protein kinase [Modestobacter lapidis]|nr:serine/threonine protein kinase [Modestobacter lapidis]